VRSCPFKTYIKPIGKLAAKQAGLIFVVKKVVNAPSILPNFFGYKYFFT